MSEVIKMKQAEIKKRIEKIIEGGAGILCTDDGSGSAGPWFADTATLQGWMENDKFTDAAVVKFDPDLQRDSSNHICYLDDETDWIQIEFNYHNNGYRQIAWIW